MMKTLTDNRFLMPLALLGLPASAACAAQEQQKPNFLIIQCDQLATRAVGVYGQMSGHTDAVDSLASRGAVFANAYTACPLSQPSRTGLLTGLYPHQTGVRTNSGLHINHNVDPSLPTLGNLFSEAGYNAVHFGKTHDMGALAGFKHKEPQKVRFKDPQVPVNQDSFKDVGTCADAEAFLRNPGAGPFICMVDFQNPHNICGYVGENIGPRPVPDADMLPPLPPNFEVEDWSKLPVPIQFICCNHRRLEQASHWSDDNYRQYIAAYLRYVDIVEKQIERVLAALNSTPSGSNTIIVFLADHGDAMASHRMVTKFTDFYEEEVKVPFVFYGPGIVRQEKPAQMLVQTTTDLVPTLCGLAGIRVPSSMKGKDLSSFLKGGRPGRGHGYVVSEWHSEYDRIVSPGRMVRTPGFKYTCYLEGGGEELYDLVSDPFEKHNLAFDPGYAGILKKHRALLRKHVRKTGDDFFSLEVKVDPRYRNHKPGYPNHVEGTGLWNFCNPTKAD